MKDVKASAACLEQYCKHHGIRLTKKRKGVLSLLLNVDKALSVYDLVGIYKREFRENISAMSLYRILDFLQSVNLVHRLNLNKKYVACSHIHCDHEHATPQFMICTKCQHVKEVTVDQALLNSLEQSVREAGFHLTSTQLEVNCVCENCLV